MRLNCRFTIPRSGSSGRSKKSGSSEDAEPLRRGKAELRFILVVSIYGKPWMPWRCSGCRVVVRSFGLHEAIVDLEMLSNIVLAVTSPGYTACIVWQFLTAFSTQLPHYLLSCTSPPEQYKCKSPLGWQVSSGGLAGIVVILDVLGPLTIAQSPKYPLRIAFRQTNHHSLIVLYSLPNVYEVPSALLLSLMVLLYMLTKQNGFLSFFHLSLIVCQASLVTSSSRTIKDIAQNLALSTDFFCCVFIRIENGEKQDWIFSTDYL